MFLSRIHTLAVAFLLTASLCVLQVPIPPANFDEDKVPKFELTDPLKTSDGRKVDTPELWNTVRRPELLKLFEEEMFGKSPLPLSPIENLGTIGLQVSIQGVGLTDSSVFNGKGTRSQIRLGLHKRGEESKEDPKIDVLIYKPNNVEGKIPALIGLNFRGNHTVDADPGIHLGTVWKTPRGGWDGRDDVLVP